MKAKAILKYARISPRKVSNVLDLVRNKPVKYASAVFKFKRKRACEYLAKLLNSAVSNAVNNYDMDMGKLYVSECFVCPGPIIKRSRPVSKGRSHRILKRTSHVTIVVEERE